MTEDLYDVDDAISMIMRGESCDSNKNLHVSVDSLIEILKRLHDKNLVEEYNSAIRGMANQIRPIFSANLINIKSKDLEQALMKKLSYEDYKKIMKKAITHLSKNQKEWKIAKTKVKK